MIDALHNDAAKPPRKLRQLVRICKAPLFTGFLGAAALFMVLGLPQATAFAQGALLVTAALMLSAGFYLRSSVPHAGLMLFRLLVALAVKWTVVLGGALYVLANGGVAPGAFVAGLVTALAATLIGFGLNE